MKRLFPVLCILFLALIGCGKDSNKLESTVFDGVSNKSALLNDTLVISYKACKVNEVEHLSICFDSVITDSRCPEGAQCFWAGYASAMFKFSHNSQTSSIRLSTDKKIINDTTINGYTISLVGLTPYPKLNQVNTLVYYEAKIVILKQ